MSEYTRDELNAMYVDDLRDLARMLGMKGQVISYMSKEGLIAAILENGTEPDPYDPPEEEEEEDDEDDEEQEPAAVPVEPDPASIPGDPDPSMAPGEPASQPAPASNPVPPPPSPLDPLAKVIADAVKQYLETGGLDEETVKKVVEGSVNGKMVDVETRMNKHVGSLMDKVDAAVAKAAKRIKQRPIVIDYTTPNMPSINLGLQHFMFEEVLKAILALPPHDRNIFLVGPAGAGKNSLVENIAKALNVAYDTMPVGLNTSKADILGYMHAGGGYVGTSLRRSYENGGVFLMDEVDAGNPNVLTCINAMTANGHGGFPDQLVPRSLDHVFMGAANTYGLGADQIHVGRLQMDGPTRDRFVFIDIPYDAQLEEAIAPNKEWIKVVHKIRKATVQLREKLIVSPRATIKGGYLVNAGFDIEKVKDMVIYRGISPEVRARIEAKAA